MICSFKKFILFLFFFNNLYPESIDLSQNWNMNTDFSKSEELESLIEDRIATLPNTLGFIVVHKGEIVSENYYNSNEVILSMFGP